MANIYFNNPMLQTGFEEGARRGATAEDAYLGRAMAYNPMANIKASAEGAFNVYRRRLKEDMESLLGSQVGQGRVRTGYGMQDQDRLMLESTDRLNSEILRNAMLGEQLSFQNMMGLGEYGARTSGDIRQGVADLEATERDRRAQEKQSKRSFWGNLAGSAMGALAMAFSDEELKEDVKPAKPVLPRVRRLKGKKWRWNEEGRRLTHENGRRHGVIAQEVKLEFPELVERDADSGRLKVDYGGLTATLVNAIGELDDKVERLGGHAAHALARR